MIMEYWVLTTVPRAFMELLVDSVTSAGRIMIFALNELTSKVDERIHVDKSSL